MKNNLMGWVSKLSAAKESAKAAGNIDGDADLSSIISEKLESANMKKVDRGAVNHWLKGRRQPNVSQFIALCDALSITPADALSTTPANIVQFQVREPAPPPWVDFTPDETEVIAEIARATPDVRRLALAVAKAALDKGGSQTNQSNRKRAK